jgi:hypothetical protein
LPCPPPPPPHPPTFWFHLFLCLQTTSGQLCCFLFNASFLDIHHCCCYQHQTSSLSPLFCPYSPSPRYSSSWRRQLEHSKPNCGFTPVPGKVGSASRMLQQSEKGNPY